MISALQHYVLGPETIFCLLNVAAASCLVCGLGLLAVHCCRNRPAPLRHGLLVAVLVLLVVSPLLLWLAVGLGWGAFDIPFATVALDTRQAHPDSLPAAHTAAGGPLGLPHAPADEAIRATLAEVGLLALQAAGTLLGVAWAVGAGVGVVGFLRGLGALLRLRKNLTAVDDAALNQAATEAFHVLGIRQVPVCQTPLALTPFSLYLFRPLIVLPEGLPSHLNSEQMRCVLLHEGAHVRRRDHWVALLQCGCAALFWWNPVVRRVNAHLVRLREQVCDDHVICAGGDGRAFAEVLVRVAEWGAFRPGAFCGVALFDESYEDLEERIVRLVQKRQPSAIRMSRASLVAVAAFALLVSAALLVSGPRAAQPPAESQRAADDAIRLASPAPVDFGKRVLGREWLMYLPAGFVHQVSLTPSGPDRYRLAPAWLNSSGLYEVRDGRLVIVEPNDRRLLGFEWGIGNDGQLTLVGQPPLGKTGSNYLGASMVPATR